MSSDWAHSPRVTGDQSGPHLGGVNICLPGRDAIVVESGFGEPQNLPRDCAEYSGVNKTASPRGNLLPPVHLPTPITVEVEHVRRRRALDLFSGTGSVRKVLQAEGWEVVSLDVNPRWGAHLVEDILTRDYRHWRPSP